MSNDFITVLNTITGQVGEVPAGYLDHPHFKNQLVKVEAGQKPYAPELYKPKTASEYVAGRKPAPAPVEDAAGIDKTDDKDKKEGEAK